MHFLEILPKFDCYTLHEGQRLIFHHPLYEEQKMYRSTTLVLIVLFGMFILSGFICNEDEVQMNLSLQSLSQKVLRIRPATKVRRRQEVKEMTTPTKNPRNLKEVKGKEEEKQETMSGQCRRSQ